MLATRGVILTTAGSLLISRSLELVKPIEFTHMKIGTGDISSIAQARKLNDLVASYKNINMSTLVRSGDLVRVRGSFTNDEITETVRIKEVGVFAKIGTEQPILFGYVNDGEGELIPPGTSGVIARTRDLYIGVTGETEVAITINKSLVYATIEDLEEGLNRKEDKFVKRSGFNLDKTDLTENNSNKVFTPKGALNLFNTLTTNFTNGINAAKEVLRLDIVKKLNKGAYLGDAQDLKNDIDSKEPIINKNSGFNKVKTDLVENDTNKVFSAKGAFDLKNWLVTNYTTLMNNIKSVLDNDIAAKLPHGGYNRTAQDLKNDVDTKVSKDGDIIKKLGSYDFKRLVVPEIVGIDINQGTTTAINTIAVEITNGWKASMLSFDLIVRAYTGSNCDTTIRFNGYTYSTNKTWVNTRAYIIGYRHNGVKVYTTTHSNGNPLIYFNFDGYLDYCNCMISNILESVPNTYKIYSIQGATGDLVPTSYMYSTTFKPTPKDINAISRMGDTIPGILTFTNTGDNIKFSDKCAIYSTNNAIGMTRKDGAWSWSMYKETGVVQYVSTPNVAGNDIYHKGNKPTPAEIGAVSKNGDNLNGRLTITHSNGGIIIQPVAVGEPSYYMIRDNDYSNIMYIGKGSANNDATAIYNYKNGAGIYLEESKIKATKNLFVNDSVVYHTGNINTYCPHRVGDIIESTNTEHPATTFIGTQWERYGDGKVIVGLSSSETEFNSVGKTGGSKTHSLIISEMPPHDHPNGGYDMAGDPNLGRPAADTAGSNTTSRTGQTGGGQPHNNLQPYIVAYRWRRTA